MGFLRVWNGLFEGVEEAFWGCERGSLGMRKRLFGETEWAVRIVVMVQMVDCQ